MPRPSPSRTAMVVAGLGAIAAGTAAAAVGSGHGRVARASVRPIPAVTGHTSQATLTFPPDTAYCLSHLGIACYAPAQFRAAYDVAPLYARGITGAGRTIVIVDSFGSPTIQHDLHVFDQTYGLPDPSLSIIQPAGAPPPFDPGNSDMVGWAEETSLDVEWSHVIAPGANILLVETPVSETEGVQGFPEIVTAENYVIDHDLGDVISQSFGATEETFPSAKSLLDLRSAFVSARKHHVTVLGASGDNGSTDLLSDTSCCYAMPVDSWPSSDPLVTSVGGTQLHLDAGGARTAPDNVWNDRFGASGGGVSSIFARPAFQNSVKDVVGSHRGTPDISMSAAVDGAVVYYWSFVPSRVGYHLVGGTSEATPLFAGIIALADQLAGERLGDVNSALYALGRDGDDAGIVDVTLGNNTFTFTDAHNNSITVPGVSAGPGYDLASGWGTVDAAHFVGALAKDNHGDKGGDHGGDNDGHGGDG